MADYDKQLRDISAYPLEVNDILILVDPVKESRHKLEVTGVEKVSDTVRLIKSRVITSSDSNVTAQRTLEFTLDATVAVQGIVIKYVPNRGGNVKLSPVKYNEIIAEGIKEYLDTRYMHKHSAPIKVVLRYLIDSGKIVEPDDEIAKRKMMSVVRSRKDLFRPSGGYLFSLLIPGVSDPIDHSSSTRSPILIDWALMSTGIKTILKSISTIKLINDDK